jgi:hypothetical protein
MYGPLRLAMDGDLPACHADACILPKVGFGVCSHLLTFGGIGSPTEGENA